MKKITKLIIWITAILIGCTDFVLSTVLSFQPIPLHDEPLIWYNSSNPKSTSNWTTKLDNFLKPYIAPTLASAKNIIYCEGGIPPDAGSDKVCNVDIHNYGPCVSSNGYGYNSDNGGPCVFLAFNTVPGWVPEYYNMPTVPDAMPNILKQHIEDVYSRFDPSSLKNNVVWVICEGENPVDVENIGSTIYFPIMGFDGAYFPMVNVDDYLNPLVAVYFERPIRNLVINVVCKAWAKNLNHEEGQGVVRFSLLVDN